MKQKWLGWVGEKCNIQVPVLQAELKIKSDSDACSSCNKKAIIDAISRCFAAERGLVTCAAIVSGKSVVSSLAPLWVVSSAVAVVCPSLRSRSFWSECGGDVARG